MIKKAFYYVGVFIGASGCLATAVALVNRQQAERRYRHQAAQDEMRLPSDSQRLMQLADTLSAQQRAALLRQYDIAKLFALPEKYPTSQDGFMGPTPQRLEVVFKQVTQNNQYPGLYQIEGLAKTKGVIRALTGTIELRQVRYAWEQTTQVYIATGTFRFTQPARVHQAATTWQGLVAIDFEVKEGRAQLFLEEGAMLPVTRGFAFEGTRSATQAKQPERVIWAANFGPLGSSILEGFGPGGRSEEVAPRYRKYGWDRYWENDEWWAQSPQPSASL